MSWRRERRWTKFCERNDPERPTSAQTFAGWQRNTLRYAPYALFEGDQIGVAESRSFGFQRLVRDIRTVLIEDLVLPDDDFVVRRVRRRVDGNDDGITS